MYYLRLYNTVKHRDVSSTDIAVSRPTVKRLGSAAHAQEVGLSEPPRAAKLLQ